MASKAGKIFRCAIYTRKSTEHGLELEFNSLDAQREACEAYIKSQASEGWRAVAKRYDDPAYSGGNIDRPAVQQLLKDIEAGQIDVVVVYKIDRLTRSLADFAKLVEVFDAKSVSFVAVTQQFNTTTSMGRLTLNVLLSFAQFERELASERVRDKIAASRKKGIWTGGSVPLGYDNQAKRLVVNPAEAKTVRMIFERYLALKSFRRLIDELNDNRIVTKKRKVTGRAAGSVSFTYGSLAYLLKNRTYLGETGYDGAWFPGEHEPILAREIFEDVQSLMKSKSVGMKGRQERTGALLTGLIFDDRGNRMTPSFTVKRGVRYPFYVSSALLRGRRTEAGSVARVSASEIEAAILIAAREHTPQPHNDGRLKPHGLVEKYIARVVVKPKRLVISLKTSEENDPAPIEIPWNAPNKRDPSIKIEGNHAESLPREANPHLLPAIILAHAWVRLLTEGTYDSIESLARSVDLHPKVVRSRIRLAFLDPTTTRMLLLGSQPRVSTVNELATSVGLGWGR